MRAITTRPATESDAAHVYALDRRGPNDPRIGSIHVVITTLLAAFVLAAFLVL